MDVRVKTRLTMAQALIRYLSAQYVEIDGQELPLFRGMFAIFGHGNVAGLGEALESGVMPVYRAHNEQAMAHAAIAYAKAMRRRRLMACTTSVGPGATNMVTAAALAHVNRQPVLLLPGDSFANRLPDPVLQQLEQFSEPGTTANDCFRPVSRFWDRITRPEQLLSSLPQAISVLVDPIESGPVTLALPQDVQAEAWDYPEAFFTKRIHHTLRQGPDERELKESLALVSAAQRPLIIAGGGVHYSGATTALSEFSLRHSIPVAETQAGKGALPWDHEFNVGAVGVTGTGAANALSQEADLVIAVGTRLQDFTTGSGLLLGKPGVPVLSINVARHDLVKRAARTLRGDARRCIQELDAGLEAGSRDGDWAHSVRTYRAQWDDVVTSATTPTAAPLPSDAGVIGVVNKLLNDASGPGATVVCAAGGLPGELHKLWRAADADSYHVEYGYSCMGYEIAGGLGVKLALPERDVVVMVGDGSYLMMNSEIATSIALQQKLIIVVLDNHGFACINRLQTSLGGKGYNNLWDSTYPDPESIPAIDFAAHAASMGALSEKVSGLEALGEALQRARQADRTSVIVIETDPVASTQSGGAWWDVPVAQVSANTDVTQASQEYREHQKAR